MRTHTLVITLLVASCQCGGTAPAVVGEACGPTRGCDEGLTCKAAVCVAVDGTGGGDATGGGGAVTGGGSATGGGMSTGGGASTGGGTGTGGTGGSSACGACNTPPSACHEQQGACQIGRCVYTIVVSAPCDDGNACTVDDACTANGCEGTPKVCNTPPAPVCVSSTDLRTYDQNGVCQGGLCVYTRNTVVCGGAGCVNNACQTNPCASVTCNTPPSVCYAAGGTCSNGSCSYPYADGVGCDDQNACTVSDSCNTGVCRGAPRPCNTPPADSCDNATTLRAYNPVGSCSAGACSYTYNFITCSAGCANARCNSSGWQRMVSNSTQDLHAVWGSSAASVWAGGELGTMLYFNGTTWQVRSSGTTRQISSIHGTSPTNVFAATVDGDILFNDGNGWSRIAAYGTGTFSSGYQTAVAAVGPKDVVVWINDRYTGAVSRLTWSAASSSWVANGGTSINDPTFSLTSVGIWAYGPGEVYVSGGQVRRWDGGTAQSSLTTVPGAAGGVRLFGLPSRYLFSLIRSGGNAYRGPLDGGAWSVLNTGYAGDLTGISGTGANRIYLSGAQYVSPTSGTGAVLFFDGQGISSEVVPAGTPRLYDVWAAPTGEVFAVGTGGAVLRGP